MWLILDRVVECIEGEYGAAECDLRPDDPWFDGHFPQRPLMPGVVIVEACAQVVAVVCRAAAVERALAPTVDVLASVQRFKFVSPAVPGETLCLEARMGRRVGRLRQARVAARVGARAVAEGVVAVTDRRSVAVGAGA
jgi:3-hydroxyacyl-[acyl-carrier-protein] dehydratase